MKDCVQWNPVYGWKYSHLSLSWTLNASMTFRRKPFRRRDNSSNMTIRRCDISSNTTFGRNKKRSTTFGRNCHN